MQRTKSKIETLFRERDKEILIDKQLTKLLQLSAEAFEPITLYSRVQFALELMVDDELKNWLNYFLYEIEYPTQVRMEDYQELKEIRNDYEAIEWICDEFGLQWK